MRSIAIKVLIHKYFHRLTNSASLEYWGSAFQSTSLQYPVTLGYTRSLIIDELVVISSTSVPQW